MKALAVATAVTLALGGSAAAEPAQPVQARAANAGFLADVGAAPAPGLVCLVDTGVETNPDTQAALIARLTVGSDPTAVGDGSLDLHGTHVAEVIAAARNGWGTVGIWPGARLVSLRIWRGGPSLDASWVDVAMAVSRCLDFRPQVINVSAAGAPTPDERAMFARVVAYARERGASVVVGAGNAGGAPEFPADVPGALAVAAWNAGAGVPCAFSAVTPGILAAQGCGVDVASASGGVVRVDGTSFAAPQVSALLAALRAFRPDLDVASAEALVTSTARAAGVVRVVDAAAAFRAAGLGQLAALVPPSTVTTAAARPRSIPRPRIVGRWLRDAALVVRVTRSSGAGRLRWSRAVIRVTADRFELRRTRHRVRAWLVVIDRAGRRSLRTWFTIPARARKSAS